MPTGGRPTRPCTHSGRRSRRQVHVKRFAKSITTTPLPSPGLPGAWYAALGCRLRHGRQPQFALLLFAGEGRTGSGSGYAGLSVTDPRATGADWRRPGRTACRRACGYACQNFSAPSSPRLGRSIPLQGSRRLCSKPRLFIAQERGSSVRRRCPDPQERFTFFEHVNVRHGQLHEMDTLKG